MTHKFTSKRTILFGKNKVGKKTKEIIIIPKKKKNENIKFLIIIDES